jgi:hypothetical protein
MTKKSMLFFLNDHCMVWMGGGCKVARAYDNYCVDHYNHCGQVKPNVIILGAILCQGQNFPMHLNSVMYWQLLPLQEVPYIFHLATPL